MRALHLNFGQTKMNVILSNSEYAFDASEQEITLVAPFDTIDEERILRITNLTTRVIIYDSGRRTYPISVSAGVITHTYDLSGMADADILQIMVDVPAKSTESVQEWTSVAQNTLSKSAEFDLSGVGSAVLHIQAGLDTTTAHTGTEFFAQTSGASSGDEDWHTHADFVALIGTAATDAIEDDPLAAGSTAIALTGHALTVLGKWLFIEDGTLANSELVMESAQTANEIVIIDGTSNAHAVGTDIFNVAMEQNITLPKSALRGRVIVVNTYDADGSTLNYKVRVSKATGV